MVSFDNTEIAFESKSNRELKKAHFLFSVLGKRWMVNAGKILTNIAFGIHFPVNGIIRQTIFRQFVGGESIEDCERTIALLAKYGIGTILDYSVEGQEDESSFEATEKELLRTIEKSRHDGRLAFSVFKVTGIARHYILEKVSRHEPLNAEEQKEWQNVYDRVHRLCQHAFDAGKPVLIDAEESWIQQAIDDLALDMMRKYNREKAIVYNTIQMYRHDRLAYLHHVAEIAEKENFLLGLKIVRGAYMEKERNRAQEKGYPDPIQATKENSDKDFDAAVEFCVQHIHSIAICAGTHNEASSMKLVSLMRQAGIAPDHPHVYFAQLLGMSDHISFNLSKAGYQVAKYVPYGPVKKVVPYLIRRAEENTSVKGQTGRELSLILKELSRRKLS